jgi:CheY-like chemotaxis protein
VADATQLHQVLMNLCVNARDAMPAGGKLTLSVQNTVVGAEEAALHPPAKAGPHLLLTVADSGQGIARENLDRIFEPFFTTKEIGRGTGLGLSTVLGLVKSHGGFIIVNSELGRGTAFKIYLPAEPSTALTEAVVGAAPRRGQRELILVVDDEAAIRTVLRHTLEARDYRVLLAADGQQALALFLQHRAEVRLVLTDLMMPKMNGVALIRALRGFDPKLKFIAMSGLQDRDRNQELAAFGVTEVLAKPASPEEILAALQRQFAAPD